MNTAFGALFSEHLSYGVGGGAPCLPLYQSALDTTSPETSSLLARENETLVGGHKGNGLLTRLILLHLNRLNDADSQHQRQTNTFQ